MTRRELLKWAGLGSLTLATDVKAQPMEKENLPSKSAGRLLEEKDSISGFLLGAEGVITQHNWDINTAIKKISELNKKYKVLTSVTLSLYETLSVKKELNRPYYIGLVKNKEKLECRISMSQVQKLVLWEAGIILGKRPRMWGKIVNKYGEKITNFKALIADNKYVSDPELGND